MLANLGLRRRWIASGALTLAAASPAFGHDGQPIAPHDLWTAWTFDPVVLVVLTLTLAVFARGALRIRSHARRWPTTFSTSAWCFAAGWVILALSLVTPLHALGAALFSAHMAQHELLMVVAAPLLVAARPNIPAVWSLSGGRRMLLGGALRSAPVAQVWAIVASPLVAFALHGLAIWIWHIPALYTGSVDSELLHTAQHLSFLVTAILFWWSVFPSQGRGRKPAAIFSLFATALHTSVLGALLTFSGESWYRTYQASTGAWGMSPVEDQQLGGLIMWIPGGLTYLVVALLAIAKLLREPSGRHTAGAAFGRTVRVAARSGVMLLLLASACRRGNSDSSELVIGANADRGREIMPAYGCNGCHVIPGVRAATGKVGPPLAGMADRSYIAGRVANEPDNMVDWIRDPQRIDSLTAMPNTGVTARDARDIAAYLYTLK